MALIYDEEFSELLGARRARGLLRLVAWPEDGAGDDPALEDADRRHRRRRPRPARGVEPVRDPDLGHDRHRRRAPSALSPTRWGRWRRCSRRSRCAPASATMIAAPLFHSWGFAHFMLGLSLGSTYVLRAPLRPRGDAARRRRSSGATALVVVPVMMQRILELPDATLDRTTCPTLRVTAASGSALPGSSWRSSGWTVSATTSTTSTARRRSPGRRSRRRRTCARRPAPPAARRAARRSGSSTPTATDVCRRARPAAYSSATRWRSRATPAAAARRSLEGLLSSGDVGPLRRATVGCSSTAATTR